MSGFYPQVLNKQKGVFSMEFVDLNLFLRNFISSVDYFFFDVVVWLSQFFPGLIV